MQEAVPVGTGAMAAILGLDADMVAQACARGGAGRGRRAGEPQRRRPGRDCRRESRRRARGRAGKGAGRQARRAAGGERAVPLRADEAGRGSPRAGAARAADAAIRACRSSRTSTRCRSATARRRSRRSSRQVSAAVRWEECVRRLASEGVTTYVEVGPGTVLSGLIRKIHRDADSGVSVGAPEDIDAVERRSRRSGRRRDMTC